MPAAFTPSAFLLISFYLLNEMDVTLENAEIFGSTLSG